MEKELQLLYNRLKKIEERNFDLNSWKVGTIAVLDTVLGPENHKRKLIESIDYQNNSWSLRDTTGDVDSVKRICADILETIIQEVEVFGVDRKIDEKKDNSPIKNQDIISLSIKHELSQKQFDELMELLNSEGISASDIVDKFKRFGYEIAPRIIARILMNDEVKKTM